MSWLVHCKEGHVNSDSSRYSTARTIGHEDRSQGRFVLPVA